MECDNTFDTLTLFLVEAPMLGYPMNRCDFILDTDTSDVGMGAVLSQIQDGVEREISYFSKTFSKCERNSCNKKRVVRYCLFC
jgi:hypothetical protein